MKKISLSVPGGGVIETIVLLPSPSPLKGLRQGFLGWCAATLQFGNLCSRRLQHSTISFQHTLYLLSKGLADSIYTEDAAHSHVFPNGRSSRMLWWFCYSRQWGCAWLPGGSFAYYRSPGKSTGLDSSVIALYHKYTWVIDSMNCNKFCLIINCILYP